MKFNQGIRILAVEVRHSRFGYALFEGPKRLLDWGASAISPILTDRSDINTARRRIALVLERSHPTALVAKRPRLTKTGRSSSHGPMLKAILREAAVSSTPIHFLSREEVRSAFHNFRAQTKEDVAEILVRVFPELIVRLPRRKKKWQTERRAMIVFDAIATGFAYWQRNNTQCPPSP